MHRLDTTRRARGLITHSDAIHRLCTSRHTRKLITHTYNSPCFPIPASSNASISPPPFKPSLSHPHIRKFQRIYFPPPSPSPLPPLPPNPHVPRHNQIQHLHALVIHNQLPHLRALAVVPAPRPLAPQTEIQRPAAVLLAAGPRGRAARQPRRQRRRSELRVVGRPPRGQRGRALAVGVVLGRGLGVAPREERRELGVPRQLVGAGEGGGSVRAEEVRGGGEVVAQLGDEDGVCGGGGWEGVFAAE